MNSDLNLQKILRQYYESSNGGIEPADITICEIKTGLIHTSFRVTGPDGDWLLQQINTNVFRNIDGLMSNIDLINRKLANEFSGSPYETLELRKSQSGDLYVSEDGAFWRVYGFKSHLKGYHAPLNMDMVLEAGKAFATFTQALSDLDPRQLHVTIPYFHSLEHRYQQLHQAKQAPKACVDELFPIFEQLEGHYHTLIALERAMKSGSIPIRITHNDSKFNNLMFDRDGNARCVVDLDTVMPGIIHFDIGDCLRTLVPNIPEDSPDLGAMELNSSYEQTFLQGYMEVADSWITEKERELIAFSGPYMALIMGIRFLTDHLNGNVYFSCDYPQQNLVRARNQLLLCREWGVGSGE